MTDPVGVYEDDTLMLSRKVTEHWCLLRPTRETRALVGFMVLYWAERYGIEVLAIIVLSNHFHVVYRDPHGLSPAFTTQVDHWIARIMNRRLDRTGHAFFGPGPCRPLRCLDPDDVDRKLDYVVTNAVRHGLCPSSYSWPGLLFGPEDAGRSVEYPRPPELAGSNVFPRSVRVEILPPAHLRTAPLADVHRKFAALRKRLEEHVGTRRKGKFLGVRRAMTAPLFHRPKNPKNSGFKPFFVGRDPESRAAAAKTRAQFLVAYRACMKRFRDGARDIEWPPGTYKMRRCYALPPPC